MVDITVTPADVLLSSGTSEKVTYGATILQGKSVYKDSSDGKWKLAQADGTADEAGATDYGVALTSGANNQQGLVAKAGAEFDPGVTPTVAEVYVISTTAGGIAPIGDLVSTDKLTIIGYGDTSGNIVFMQGGYSGEAIP